MTDLAREHCKAAKKGDPPLEAAAVNELVAQLHGDWQLADEGRAIRREFTFKNFYETMGFVNALAWIANREDHHPDLEVGYKRCLVQFSTHAIGGLSRNDFVCAARTDELV